jgi:hypothetical protein
MVLEPFVTNCHQVNEFNRLISLRSAPFSPFKTHSAKWFWQSNGKVKRAFLKDRHLFIKERTGWQPLNFTS